MDQRIFDTLISESLPEIHKKFRALHIDVPLFSAKWFLCLFYMVLPSEVTAHVWDYLLLCGANGAIVLMTVGLALLRSAEPQLTVSITAARHSRHTPIALSESSIARRPR